MAIVVIFQIVAGILGAVFRDRVRDVLNDRVNEALDMYNGTETPSDIKTFIDGLQRDFDCCGYNGPGDWLNTTFGTFPESCRCTVEDCKRCAPFTGNCDPSLASNGSFVWIQGCDRSVIEGLEDNLGVVAGVGVSFGLFQLSGVAIALALCICSCMKRKKEDDFPVDDYVY
jgi:hypothetical protein